MIGAFRAPDDARWYRLSLGALVLASWVALWAWGTSPFAGLLSHREVGSGSVSTLAGKGAVMGADPIFRLAVFVAGWTLMSVAMMLPASLPLVNLFRSIVDRRPDRAGLVLRLVLGYLGVWTYFGALAYTGDAVLHEIVRRLPGLAAGGLGAAILLAAGLYQFTPLKQMCLDKCRSPYSFLVENWRGQQMGRNALRLGARHGLFCVGCCWTLMLLMFAIGGANLGWMLALGAVMAAERTTRWGRHLTRPLGAVLVLWAVLHVLGRAPFPGA